MPDWLFPLPIFPEGSLASSVITTVWVGVFVIAFFNLRFGWVLSGLVVPGYLVPLLIARPISFVVILVEATVTYFLVWLFSERLSGGRSWSSLFGRDRFVGLVLASIVVRLSFDAWLLPQFAAVLQRDFVPDVDWRGNLHSFGLIVISLLANQLWKPGFLRGMTQALVTIGLTFLVVRYGLMELTNFRISAVTYLYEDLASSILASPKAYIILIVTALLASRMNLRYGWDFNGVLIPALIALQWYQPLKVLTSFAEAFVIYGLAILLLRLPVFANMTIEGARKLLLFFNIGFAYRLLIGHAFYWAGLDVQVTDYYGFGYLLSTLMAIKMFDKDILARLTRTTLQISVAGTALGSAIGFAMMVLIPVATPATAPADGGAPQFEDRALDPASIVGAQMVAAYTGWRTSDEGTPAPAEFEAFREGLRRLIVADDNEMMAQASSLLGRAGFSVQRIGGGVLAITDTRENRRGGTFLINPSGFVNLTVSVPDPLAAPGLAPASLRLMQATGARTLALAGTSASLAGSDAPKLEQDYASFFQAFHEAVEGGVLRVVVSTGPGRARLRIPTRLPPGLDAAAIEELVGTLEIGFGREGGRIVQEVAAREGFATLHLGGSDVAQILQAGMAEPDVVQGEEGIQAYLLGVATEHPAESAVAPLALAELLFFDREVLAPLLRDVIPTGPAGSLTGKTRAALAPIRQAAGIMGYGVTIYRHTPTGRAHLVLEPHAAGRGIYAFRLTPEGGAYMIQVPRPGHETNTLEYGVALFDRLDARAILIPEAAPSANPGDAGAPGMREADRPASLFDLVSQVVLREHGGDPTMVVQIRGYSAETAKTLPPHDAIIAFDVLPVGGSLSGLAKGLVTEARAGGADVGIVTGKPETAGLEVGWVRQARYLEATEAARFAIVWLSPALRSVYADRSASSSETALFEALGIETVEATPSSFVQARGAEAATLAPEFIESIATYQAQRDSVALRQAQVAFPTGLKRIYDPASRQTFLAVLSDGGAVHALANLSPRDLELRVEIPAGVPDLAAIDRFVTTRAAWVLVTGVP